MNTNDALAIVTALHSIEDVPPTGPTITQELVNDNLNNALDNSAWNWIVDSDPEQVARDMLAYSPDCDHLDDTAILIPFIIVWQNAKKGTPENGTS